LLKDKQRFCFFSFIRLSADSYITKIKTENMRKTVLMLIQLGSILFSGRVISQSSPTVPLVSPGGVFDIVFDQFGNQYSLANLSLNSTRNIGGPNNTIASNSGSCLAGYFTLWFTQGSLFDTSAHAQTIICELFRNYSGFINSSIAPGSINIKCGDVTSGNASGQGISYFVLPLNPSNPNPGIVMSQMQKALITGADPYVNIPINFYNATNFYHASILANPNTAWTYSLNSISTGSLNVDFYSIMLHEVAHCLGIINLIGNSGYSLLGQTNNYFTVYDQFLYDAAGNPLLTTTTPSCSNSNLSLGSNSTSIGATCTNSNDVTTCSTAVQYSSSAVTLTVYNPPCFENGSSLFILRIFASVDTPLHHPAHSVLRHPITTCILL
jgi:hypothetical protein